MNFYLVEFKEIPKLVLSHIFETEQYRIAFDPQPDAIEISYVEEGDVECRYEDGSGRIFTVPAILTNFYQRKHVSSSPAPLHRHATFCLKGAYNIRPIDVPEMKLLVYNFPTSANGMLYVILPDYLPENAGVRAVHPLFYQLIQTASEAEIAGEAQCLGLVLQLTAQISRLCLDCCLETQKGELSPGALHYCRRTIQYISAHIQESITLKELSDHAGIHSAYLGKLFKIYTGHTIVDYITAVKMNRIRELVFDRNLSLKTAGEQMGYFDEQYLSRLFRKQFGMSIREYRMLLSNVKKEQ